MEKGCDFKLKTKILCFLLLFCTLLLPHPVELAVYAADEKPMLAYSGFVDEIAGMDQPYWSFDYYPKLKFEHKFLFFEWGQAETVGWNIDTVSYYFTMNNEHIGEFLVGYNPSDMDIVFEYVYSSVDGAEKYTSSASFIYSLADTKFDNNYVEFVFPYEEVLAGSEYYEQGLDTIIKSVEICIYSRVLKKCGTIMHYEFYHDDAYSKQIYTGIDYYTLTDDDMSLVSTQAGSFKDVDTTIDWAVLKVVTVEISIFIISL